MLAFERDAILTGEIWRLWTGHVVHFSWSHALADLPLLGIALFITWREIGLRPLLAIAFFAPPILSCALLWLIPDLVLYQGASGLTALFTTLASVLVWQRCTRWEVRGLIALLGLLFLWQIYQEATGHSQGMSQLPEGVKVVWQIHLIGALLGYSISLCKRPNKK